MWIGVMGFLLAAATTAPTLEEARRLFESGHCDEGRKATKFLLAAVEKTDGVESLAAARALDLWVEQAVRCHHAEDGKTLAMAERAVVIKEKVFGPDHVEVATSLFNFARTVSWEAPPQKLGLAAASLDRARAIREKAFGADDPRLIPIVERLLMIADLTGTMTVAEHHALEEQQERIWKKAEPDVPRWMETVGRADRIEVARLQSDSSYKGPGFPVYPNSSFAKVLDTRTVAGADLAPLVGLFRAVIERPGSQAQCHQPAFGLRFWHGEERPIETSLCFQCNNLSLPTVAGDYRWVSMTDDKEVSGRLLAALQALFAPPAAAAAPTTKPKSR
jgi:hypothetical protein